MSLTDDLMEMGHQEERVELAARPRPSSESRLTTALVLLPWVAWLVTLAALLLVVLRE